MTLGLDSLQYSREYPEKVFAVSEDGSFINKMDANKTKLKNTQYWINQYRKVGVVMLVSSLILISMLLFETKIVEVIWETGLNIIGGLL